MAIKLNRKGVGLSGAERDKENANLTLIEQEFKRVGDAVPVADDAKKTADEAKAVASAADTKSKNVQLQLDNIVVEGDSSPQAAQASVSADGTIYPSLKARLDAEQQAAAALFVEKTSRLKDISINVKDFGAKGDWNGTTGTDNLTAFKNAVNALPSNGGEILISDGDFWLSDSWNIDKDNVTVNIMPGATVRTTKPTTGGHTIGFIGYMGLIYASTPQRKNAKIYGGGTVRNSSSGTNENAVAAVRYSGFDCSEIQIPEANRKAVTCQYGVDNIRIKDLDIGITGHSAISIETTCRNIAIENINMNIVGDRAILIASESASKDMENISIKNINCNEAKNDGLYIDKFKNLNIEDFNIKKVINRGGFIGTGSGLSISKLSIDESTKEGLILDAIDKYIVVHNVALDKTSLNSPNVYDALRLQNIGNVPCSVTDSSIGGTEHRNTINIANSSENQARFLNNNLKRGITGSYTGWKPKTIHDLIDGVLYREENSKVIKEPIRGTLTLTGATNVSVTHNIGSTNYSVFFTPTGGTLIGKLVVGKSNNVFTVRSSDVNDSLSVDYMIMQ